MLLPNMFDSQSIRSGSIAVGQSSRRLLRSKPLTATIGRPGSAEVAGFGSKHRGISAQSSQVHRGHPSSVAHATEENPCLIMNTPGMLAPQILSTQAEPARSGALSLLSLLGRSYSLWPLAGQLQALSKGQAGRKHRKLRRRSRLPILRRLAQPGQQSNNLTITKRLSGGCRAVPARFACASNLRSLPC